MPENDKKYAAGQKRRAAGKDDDEKKKDPADKGEKPEKPEKAEKPKKPAGGAIRAREGSSAGGAAQPAKEDDLEQHEIPENLPILPVRNMVLYPWVMVPILVGRGKSVRLIDDVLLKSKVIGLVAQRDAEKEDPTPDDLFKVGTAGVILKMLKFPDGSLRVLIQGMKRFKVKEFTESEPYFKAKVDLLEDDITDDKELQALVQNLRTQFQKLIEHSPVIPAEVQITAMNITAPGKLADFVATHLNIELAEMQGLLETLQVKERLQKVTVLLTRELEVLELGSKIQNQIKDEMESKQRDYYLREQLKAIKKELGEGDGDNQEIEEFREKIKKAKMSAEVEKEANAELDRMSRMHPDAAEYTVSRTYLDWLTALPWQRGTDDHLDIKKAREQLDADHYDLDKVKERILEYLAVRKLKSDMKGPSLCFVGPPGVGKTSLGKSIAKSLGRKFERIALGGIRDEAEIRGHRRTYIGSLPGRVIRAIRKCDSNNPVIILDEIDKVGTDFRGDPSSALLEVLDPEQNNTFTDHYLDVPFDLSKVMFIATSNLMDPIPPALRDRMEVLEIPGYTDFDKLQIAKNYLVPKQTVEHGLTLDMLSVEDAALQKLIKDYTREAGVRNLEREVASVCRKIAKKVAEGDTAKHVIKEDDIPKLLGPEKYFAEIAERTDRPGVAIGLAWTAVGGDILFIEATKMRGKKSFRITGQLGEVMKESAEAALSYVRSKSRELRLEDDFFENLDMHVHIPAGAIPKDGPSAGVTLATAIASLLTDTPVKSNVAMTGELTLRGKVLPVGGIKEKVLAAHRAGITEVILPTRCKKDLEDVPNEIREQLKFHYVDDVDEVIRLALGLPMTPLIPPEPKDKAIAAAADDKTKPVVRKKGELPAA